MASMPENVQLKAYESIAENFIKICQQHSHINGYSKLEKKCRSELKFLLKLHEKTSTVRKSHLRSSNLHHYAAILYSATQCAFNIVGILQPFSIVGCRFSSLIVDVVCGHGLIWLKVIARKAQALHLIWAGRGQFSERDITQQVEDYLSCAQQHPINYLIPKVHFVFFNAVTQPMADWLTQLGIGVHGEIVPVCLDTQRKLKSVPGYFSDENDDDDDYYYYENYEDYDDDDDYYDDEDGNSRGSSSFGSLIDDDEDDDGGNVDEADDDGDVDDGDGIGSNSCVDYVDKDIAAAVTVTAAAADDSVAAISGVSGGGGGFDVDVPSGVVVSSKNCDMCDDKVSCDDDDDDDAGDDVQEDNDDNICQKQQYSQSTATTTCSLASSTCAAALSVNMQRGVQPDRVQSDRVPECTSGGTELNADESKFLQQIETSVHVAIDESMMHLWQLAKKKNEKEEEIERRGNRKGEEEEREVVEHVIKTDHNDDDADDQNDGDDDDEDSKIAQENLALLLLILECIKEQSAMVHSKVQFKGETSSCAHRTCVDNNGNFCRMHINSRISGSSGCSGGGPITTNTMNTTATITTSYTTTTTTTNAPHLPQTPEKEFSAAPPSSYVSSSSSTTLSSSSSTAATVAAEASYSTLPLSPHPSSVLSPSVPSPHSSSSESVVNNKTVSGGFVPSAHIRSINLDITTLITLVSAVTHGRCHYIFPENILTMQAKAERHSPVLPGIMDFIKGKKLYCCETAMRDFRTILDTLGGPTECQRAEELMSQVVVVPDCPSERAQSLPRTNKLKERSKIIFGTGDSLKAITMTANSGYVRAAKNQGVLFAVFVHASRALTEEKEKLATPITQDAPQS